VPIREDHESAPGPQREAAGSIGQQISLGLNPPILLTAAHDVSSFVCGHPSLTTWLQTRALASQVGSAKTYVVTFTKIGRDEGLEKVYSGRLFAVPSKFLRSLAFVYWADSALTVAAPLG
jgi:hypothetical protein